MENSISNFETDPGDRAKRDSDQHDAEMSKNDIARKTADLSDRLLQRKVGLG